MKPVLASLPLILAAACAAVPAEVEPERSIPLEGAGACKAESLSELVGRPATAELGAEAMRRASAERLRWIRPGDAVTMDYRDDRLNVNLDNSNRVESFNCG